MATAGQKTCANHISYTYTGKESSPMGLGYCAEGQDVGHMMRGRDNHPYVVGYKGGVKVWVRMPDTMINIKEMPPMEAVVVPLPKAAEPKAVPEKPKPVVKKPEPVDDEEEPVDEEEPAEEEEPEEEPEEKPEPKKKAAAKKPVSDAPKPKKVAAPKPKKPVTEDEDTASSVGEKKPKRAPTEYNVFVKNQIAQLRAAEPGLTQKVYMERAAVAWNDHKVAKGLPPTKVKTEEEKDAEKAKRAARKEAKKAGDTASETSSKKEKKTRAPTAYNLFVKDKIAELRAAEPGLAAKEYFSKAVAAYKVEKPAKAAKKVVEPAEEDEE